MTLKRSFGQNFVRTMFLGIAFVAVIALTATNVKQSFADPLNCSNTVTGSTQQGAICLPPDPTGASNAVPDQSVKGIILGVIQIALEFLMLLTIAVLIYGGYQFIFDGGNDERAKSGKKTIINALIGLVVIILSYTIVAIVSTSVQNLNSNGSSTGSTAATPAAPY